MSKLEVIREFDPWRSPLCTCPKKYSLHPYTGCSHLCLYCYATSYIGLKESKPKDRFLKKLSRDLTRIKPSSLIELSTSSDPYPPIEKILGLTRKALELISRYEFRLLITTKSDLVVRDADLFVRLPSAVMITITTLDEKLAEIIEPGAPPPSKRILAIRELSKQNVAIGVRVDPIIPFINDDEYGVEELVSSVVDAGALHIVTSTYKARRDSLKRLCEKLPDISGKIRRLYLETGERIHGYLYLPMGIRRRLLEPVIRNAAKHGVTYATCREGMEPGFFNAPSCDGSHLIIHKNPYQLR